MKARALIELTVDLSQPAAELAAAIGAVLSALPDEAMRVSTLEALSDEIGRALADLEAHNLPDETEAAVEVAEQGARL